MTEDQRRLTARARKHRRNTLNFGPFFRDLLGGREKSRPHVHISARFVGTSTTPTSSRASNPSRLMADGLT